MQDRVPTYPGRVTMVPVPGQPNTYDMARADQPTQEGTPLNKATLFSDTTKSRYPDGTNTVDQALAVTVLLKDKATDAEAAAGTDDTKWMTPKKVSDHLDKVGDIRTTERSTLGNKYLLANGARVADETSYAAVLPYCSYKSNTEFTTREQIYDSIGGDYPKIKYLNGYWVYAFASGSRIYLAYSQSLTGQFTSVQIPTGNVTYTKYVDLFYFKGYYIAVYGGTDVGYAYSNSLSGTWKYKEIRTGNSSNYIGSFIWQNNYLFIVYNPTKTSGNIDVTVKYFSDITQNGTTYSFTGYRGEGLGVRDSEVIIISSGRIQRSANPLSESSWSFQDVSQLASTTGSFRWLAVWFKNQWVISGKYNGTMRFWYGTYNGTWNTSDKSSTYGDQRDMLADDSYIYILQHESATTPIYISKYSSPSGSPVEGKIAVSSTRGIYTTMSFYGDDIVIAYYNGSGSPYPCIAYSSSGYFLPTVTISGAKAFIRAKE